MNDGPTSHEGCPTLEVSAERGRLLLDATLVLRWGRQSAVGIVRVDHYVYESLAREPIAGVPLDFVTWDEAHLVYRAITAQERLTLASIIFHTDEPVENVVPVAEEVLITETEALDEGPPDSIDALAVDVASAPAELSEVRIAPHRNLLVRVVARMTRWPRRAVRRLLTRPIVPIPAAVEEVALVAPPEPPPPSVSEPEPPPPPPNPFHAGDVLVSLANIWDYIDYPYLASLKPLYGVRFICALYDVCGVELPYVTPGPTHKYQRHWVEIGHIAERLISISHFSADSYRRLIAEPNHIDVPIAVAGLPNFLHARAAEIGEVGVPDLIDRDFVVFCSTIEIRKNHILLINLWEELRQRLPADRLPILVFVGKWGWYADNVRMMAERNFRLRPHLRILTDVSDAELIWLYRHASFTVFPALSEGFGLAAAESLSFGTPVIISHCPALIEATEGLMPALHPQDFMGWRHIIEHLLLNDDALAALRSKASQFRGPAYQAFAELVLRAAVDGLGTRVPASPVSVQSLMA